MPLVSSQETASDLAKKVTTTLHETPSAQVLDRAPTTGVVGEDRFPELDPELVATLNEYTETENAAFLENRKKAREARAKAAATANAAEVPNHTEPEDRSPELDFNLETKLRAQIWSDTKHHKKATGTRRLRGSN